MALESFEAQGEWWLPEAADQRIFGTLKFDPVAGAELSLAQSLRSIFDTGEKTEKDGTVTTSITMESMAESGTYPRIHGDVNGFEFTLEDCFRREGSLLGGPETVHVNAILKNVLVDAQEVPSGNAVSASFRYLTDWVSGPDIGEEYQTGDGPGVEGIRLNVERLPKDTATADSGAEVVLSHRVGVTGNGVIKRSLWQRYGVRIDTPEVRPIEDLVDLVSDVQNLVSIATGRTAEFGHVSFWHPDVSRDGLNPEPIEYFVNWNARDTSKHPEKFNDVDMFFSYPEFGGIEGVRRWLNTTAVHGASLDRVIASRYARQMFVSDRLLNRAAALEAFDRVTHTKQEYFRDRLSRCVGIAGEPFERLVGDVESWLDVIRDDRNDVAHHLGRRSRDDAPHQYFLAESLYWLFVMCVLRHCSTPEPVFDRIKKHHHMIWLGPKIAAAVQQWKSKKP